MKFSFNVFVVMTMWGLASSQVNSINSVAGSGQTQFFLDRYSDCDGTPREVGQATASISSFSTESTGKSVTSCTITLSTENIREPYRFKLEFLAVRIGEPLTQLYVYDGQSGAKLLWSFSKTQNKPNDLVSQFTTGKFVTFRFSRGEFEKDYDVRIVATPVPSTVNCNYENEYNCNEYSYVNRILGTKEIAGIIGGCFGLVIIIVIVIIIFCCCKHRGVTRKWNEEKLGNVNMAASCHSLQGQVTMPSAPNSTTGPWTSESSRNGFASIRRPPNFPQAKISKLSRNVDMDRSMSDSSGSLSNSKRQLPTLVSTIPKRTSEHSHHHQRHDQSNDDKYSDRSSNTDKKYSEKNYSRKTYSDKNYSAKSCSDKNYSEKNYRPPTYQEAVRHDSASLSSVDEHGFVQADDAHPQSVFIERVITPRVNKKSNKSAQVQTAVPPADADDSIEPKPIKKNSKALMVDKGADPVPEEIDKSDTDNETKEEDTEEESETEAPDKPTTDQTNVLYSYPIKTSQNANNSTVLSQNTGAFRPLNLPNPQVPMSQLQQVTLNQEILPHSDQYPQHRYGIKGQPTAYLQGQSALPQVSYPQVPQVPQNNWAQPISYNQANFSVPHQQQQPGVASQYNPHPQQQPAMVPQYNPQQQQQPGMASQYNPHPQQQPAMVPQYNPQQQQQLGIASQYNPHPQQQPAMVPQYNPQQQQQLGIASQYNPHPQQQPAMVPQYNPQQQQQPGIASQYNPHPQQQPAMVPHYNPHTQQQFHDPYEKLQKSRQDPAGLAPNSSLPVYSHLVNRGYRTLDGRYSPASNSTGASKLSGMSNLSEDRHVHNEDSDMMANLSSGVELMKRNN